MCKDITFTYKNKYHDALISILTTKAKSKIYNVKKVKRKPIDTHTHTQKEAYNNMESATEKRLMYTRMYNNPVPK